MRNGTKPRPDSCCAAIHMGFFDEGYMTLNPGDRRIVVSTCIREEFENGKDYYMLERQQVREPSQVWARPTAENLDFNAYNIFPVVCCKH